MSCVSPDGPVYQAGTLSGNPVAMAAGIAQLSECAKDGFYKDQEERTRFFITKINDHAKSKGYDFEMVSIASIFWFNFDGKKTIKRADQINADMSKFNKLHTYLLNNGVYIGPSGYEVGFISSKHNREVLSQAADVMIGGLDSIYN